MTSNDHPITPPEWLIDERGADCKNSFTDDTKFFARWGADQQLAICVKWLEDHGYDLAAPDLQDHCRPSKPQPPQTVVIDGHTYRLEE